MPQLPVTENVNNWGADPTGSRDSTRAFQTALDQMQAPGVLYVPPGECCMCLMAREKGERAEGLEGRRGYKFTTVYSLSDHAKEYEDPKEARHGLGYR